MATRVSVGTGNFTTAGTWGAVSAVANAEVDSEAGSINVSTSALDSTGFVLAATATQHIAIKISSIITPTGTLAVSLRNSTSPGTRDFTVTINCSDLRADANGWHVFKAGASVTPNGTDTYVLRLLRSVADGASNRVTVYATSSTAATMNRSTVLTTTGAPAANEKIIIAGNFTGASAGNSYTITMDNTATTSFGPTVSGGPPQGVTVNDKSTMTWGTAASAYYLKWKGVFKVNPGGTINVGTSGSHINSSGSATLFMDSVANVDSGLHFASGSAVNMYGATKTRKVFLGADAAAAATNLTLASSPTGWINATDVVAFASTTRTASQCENKTVSTITGAALVLTAGLTNAHSGTAPTQAEVINITSNLVVTGASGTLQGYVIAVGTAVVNISQVEFTLLGSATASKTGFDVQITTGTLNVDNCALHDFTVAQSDGFKLSTTISGTVALTNNVLYKMDRAGFELTAASGAWTIDGNTVLGPSVQATGLFTLTASATGATLSNNTAVGGVSVGFDFNWTATTSITISGNTAHSNASFNFQIRNNFYTAASQTFTSTTSWRSNNSGISLTGLSPSPFIFNTMSMFGNTTDNLNITGAVSGLVLKGVTSNGDTTFSTTNGLNLSTNNTSAFVSIVNSTFSVASGILTAHTNDIAHGSSTLQGLQIYGDYIKLSGTNPISNQTSFAPWEFLRISGWNQAANTHKSYFKKGTVDSDTSVFHTASPSEKLTPNSNSSASDRFESGPKRAAVISGNTLAVNVWVRASKASTGDSADYNGTAPSLVVKQNYQAGILVDTVLDTVSVAIGNWEQLTGTTAAVTDNAVLEFVVNCDGTAGFINDDDWTIS